MPDLELEPLEASLRRLLEVEAKAPPDELAKVAAWERLGGQVAAHYGATSAAALAGRAASSWPGYLATFIVGSAVGVGGHYLWVSATPQPSVASHVVAPALPERTSATPVSPAASTLDPPAVDELSVKPGGLASEREDSKGLPLRASGKAVVTRPKAGDKTAAPPEPPVSTGGANPTTASGLARERALVDAMRAALARGNTKAVFDAAARHHRDFPEGQLHEEVHALRVMSLAREGHAQAAKRAAQGFHRRYPGSLLTGAVRAAVAAPTPTTEKTNGP